MCVFLKWCDLQDDWKKMAQDKGAWRCMEMEVASDSNEYMEAHEKIEET